MTLEDWADLLDACVFFWPRRRGAALARSLEGRDAVRLSVDPERLFAAMVDHVWLSPIKSGNATRRAARRGPWLWVPVREVGRFAANRHARGLLQGATLLWKCR